MAQSSMLQSLPAPLRSILRDPTAIAVLASIGVHGLLWAVLPYLPLSARQPTEAEIQREVGLVQLSPEELARVPQFDTPATIPIPAAPPPVDLGRLPQQFSITPLPTPSFPPSISAFPPDSLFVPRFPRQPSRSFPRTTAPPTTQPRRSAPTATPTATPTPAPTPTPTPSPLPSPAVGETISPDGTPIENVPPIAGSPTSTPTTTPSPGETPSSNPPETASSPTPRLTPEQIAAVRTQQQRDREFLTSFNIAGTSARRGEVTAAIEAWITDITPQLQAGNSTGEVGTVTIRIPTSRETCLARQQLQATYGVLIDSDGDRVGDPRLLMSSGFALLNSRALEAVTDKDDFRNETGTIQPFQVNVVFQYNAADCASIAAPSPPASEGTS